MDLSDIGIDKGRLCEVIVTTYHEDGSPNAAPMGVIGMGRDRLLLRVHTNTDTWENIRRGGSCVINIVFDPMLFLVCSLHGRHKGPVEVETRRVKKASSVNAPYLVDAHAYLEAELESCKSVQREDVHGSATIAEINMVARGIEILSPFPIAPNRGFFAAVELAIALSRRETRDVKRYMDIIKRTLGAGESKRIEEFVNETLGT